MIRLLIADDEALERETLADIVARRFEHEVTIETAENGRKAADTAVLWGADLILMDIEMPGMNGLDAARAVLEQRPECKVIFVTAYSLFQYAHEAMHLGACDYLLKPVNPDEVEASIRKAIRQIEAGRRLAELAPVEPELFRQMKEYYKVDFDVRNPQILQYKCTCKFRQEDGLKHILEILQRIHRFEYEWSDDEQTVIIR